MPKNVSARHAAVAALLRLHRGGRATEAAAALDTAGLAGRDRAFAGALFLGAAERLLTLDALLEPLLSRPVAKLDPEVRAVLEAGLYQMAYMRVPPRAAVDEAVKLARSFGRASAAGMVNAVLRKAAGRLEEADLPVNPGERTEALLAGRAFGSEAERIQARYSVGPAVARAVMAALPEDYEAFFAASFASGEVCVRTNTARTDRARLAAALEQNGVKTRPGRLAETLYLEKPGPLAADPLFQSGQYHVQGEASQYACACLDARPGQRVLDVCAAPGGKAATLAQAMGGQGRLMACDISPKRLALVGETMARLGLEGPQAGLAPDTRVQDASVYDAALEGQDRVLCDVPCSGLGVLAAKPDLRYTDGAYFEGLPALQLKILQTSARYVKQGGRLVYATCTLRPQENAGVVERFLAEAPEFALAPPENLPPGALEDAGMVTLLPHRTGLADGFFLAILHRI